jgi:lysozyme
MIVGTDISKWQDDNSTAQQVDFRKMKGAGAYFTFIKVSQATYLDQDYIYNWSNAKAYLPRGGYHFLDWTKSAAEQARFFTGVLLNDPGELPAIVDFECRTNVPAQGATRQALKDFTVEFKKVLPNKKLAIYTSPSYWKEFGSPDLYWKQFELWIAHYGVSKPTIPLPWTNWVFWQYTASGNGIFYGAESKEIDLDYFNGSAEQFYSYLGITEPELTCTEKVDILWREAQAHGWNLVK